MQAAPTGKGGGKGHGKGDGKGKGNGQTLYDAQGNAVVDPAAWLLERQQRRN